MEDHMKLGRNSFNFSVNVLEFNDLNAVIL